MGTNIRPELSNKSPYWIERHRYYELKHFCLQYPIWKRAYAALGNLGANPQTLMLFSKTNQRNSPTERCAVARLYYLERMKLVEQAAYRSQRGAVQLHSQSGYGGLVVRRAESAA